MEYKGYRILISESVLKFFEIDKEGAPLKQKPVNGINYEEGDPEWVTRYAVIDKDGWLLQSYSELQEAKDYIDEEL